MSINYSISRIYIFTMIIQNVPLSELRLHHMPSVPNPFYIIYLFHDNHSIQPIALSQNTNVMVC